MDVLLFRHSALTFNGHRIHHDRQYVTQADGKTVRLRASDHEGGPTMDATAVLRRLVSMASTACEGAAPAIAETLQGLSQIILPNLFTAYPVIRASQLRALAVAGSKRLAAPPDVPALTELGVTGVDVVQWIGLFALDRSGARAKSRQADSRRSEARGRAWRRPCATTSNCRRRGPAGTRAPRPPLKRRSAR